MSKRHRARRALRRLVALALSKAVGPEKVYAFQNPDGTIVVAPKGAYLWRGTLPDGYPFAFTTETPVLQYAGLVDALVAGISRGRQGWSIIEHTPECRALG